MLSDGFHALPPGKIATIVTHLEMRARPNWVRPPDPPGLRLVPMPAPTTDWYRALFRRVGAQDWLWTSRLKMPVAQLAQILADPGVKIWAVEDSTGACGLLELDLRDAPDCELAFFGLEKHLTGQGVGRWLMSHALEKAWEFPIERLHVHTCTLDSPAALPFYIRTGFTPIRQEVEIAPDPRLSGLIDARAAPQIPIIQP